MKKLKSQLTYHNYLKTKSFFGSIYRNHFIYPRLIKFISGNLLDFGCGLGDMLKIYKNSIGVDVNKYNIDYCLKRDLNAYLLDDFLLTNKKFDSIVLDNVIEHITMPSKIIKNIKKFSKKNTILIIGVPGIKAYESDDDHKVFYDEKNLVPLLKNNNFMLIHSFSTPWKSELLNKYSKRYCNYFVFKYL